MAACFETAMRSDIFQLSDRASGHYLRRTLQASSVLFTLVSVNKFQEASNCNQRKATTTLAVLADRSR